MWIRKEPEGCFQVYSKPIVSLGHLAKERRENGCNEITYESNFTSSTCSNS